LYEQPPQWSVAPGVQTPPPEHQLHWPHWQVVPQERYCTPQLPPHAWDPTAPGMQAPSPRHGPQVLHWQVAEQNRVCWPQSPQD